MSHLQIFHEFCEARGIDADRRFGKDNDLVAGSNHARIAKELFNDGGSEREIPRPPLASRLPICRATLPSTSPSSSTRLPAAATTAMSELAVHGFILWSRNAYEYPTAVHYQTVALLLEGLEDVDRSSRRRESPPRGRPLARRSRYVEESPLDLSGHASNGTIKLFLDHIQQSRSPYRHAARPSRITCRDPRQHRPHLITDPFSFGHVSPSSSRTSGSYSPSYPPAVSSVAPVDVEMAREADTTVAAANAVTSELSRIDLNDPLVA